MTTIDKDRWIRAAIARRYLSVKENGSIYRARKADAFGIVDPERGYALVMQQTHKPTERVYFNLSYMGFKKSVLVNRVVAWAFHPNPDNLPQVNHKDGNKANNGKDNLEWASNSDNEKHAHRTGLKSGRGSSNSNAVLTANDVTEIRASEEKPAAIAKKYGVSRSTIANVIARRTWSHV